MPKPQIARKAATYCPPFTMPGAWWRTVEGLAALFGQDPRELLVEALASYGDAAKQAVIEAAKASAVEIGDREERFDACFDRKHRTARRAGRAA